MTHNTTANNITTHTLTTTTIKEDTEPVDGPGDPRTDWHGQVHRYKGDTREDRGPEGPVQVGWNHPWNRVPEVTSF